MTKTELIKEGKRLLEISDKKFEQIMDLITFRVYECGDSASELMKKSTIYQIENFWKMSKSTLMKKSKFELELSIDEIKQTTTWHELSLYELSEGLAYEQTPEPIEENKCGHCGEPMEDGSHCTESEQYKGICVECEYHNLVDYDHDDDYPGIYETWVGDQDE